MRTIRAGGSPSGRPKMRLVITEDSMKQTSTHSEGQRLCPVPNLDSATKWLIREVSVTKMIQTDYENVGA